MTQDLPADTIHGAVTKPDRDGSNELRAHTVSARVVIVLCRTIYPRNLGMCARALANMGGGQLIAIAPRFPLDHEEAKQGAAGAQEALSAAITYQSWTEFLATEGEGVLIALSGKDGRARTPEILEDRLERMRNANGAKIQDVQTPVYLIFGPEDDGLSPEELEDVHHVCRIATYGHFSSLNLSHACIVALSAVQRFLGATPMDCAGLPPFNAAQSALAAKRLIQGPRYFPEQSIHDWLEVLGFDLSNRRVHAGNILKRILLENEPTADELRVLDAVIRQTTRKLRGLDSPPSIPDQLKTD